MKRSRKEDSSKKRSKDVPEAEITPVRLPEVPVKTLTGASVFGSRSTPRAADDARAAMFSALTSSFQPSSLHRGDAADSADASAALDALAAQLPADIDAVRKSETFTGADDQVRMLSSVMSSTAGALSQQTLQLLALQRELADT